MREAHLEEEVEEEDADHGSLWGYYTCLRDHRGFRLLFLASVVDNLGAWLSYVSLLGMVERFSGGSGLALSAVVLIRFLPALLLGPVVGVVADRCNRVRTMVVASLADAALVAALALVRRPEQAWLLYVLLAAQFTGIAFYDPARHALIPLTVPKRQLSLATTIDSFAWSLTGAVGASIGGVIASRLGNSTCFLLDGATYLVAAWCAAQLPLGLGQPGATASASAAAAAGGDGALRKSRGGLDNIRSADPAATEAELADVRGGGRGGAAGHDPQGGRPSDAWVAVDVGKTNGGAPGASGGKGAAWLLEDQREILAATPDSGKAAEGPGTAWPGDKPPSVLWGAAADALAGGLGAAAEGWRFMAARGNRGVAGIVCIKACGSLAWGAVDLLNVRFSEMPSLQSLGDQSTTLGLIFATVGLGCFLGPIGMNRAVAPRRLPLMVGVAASFAFVAAGFGMMLAGYTQGIGWVLAATFVRSIGSSTLWVYSTLLLQLTVPNSLLGRMSALDMAFFTLAEMASSLLAGAAFDLLHASLFEVVAAFTAVAVAMAVAWAGLAAAYVRRLRAGDGGVGGQYLPVARHEPEDG